jgi:Fe-S cluster biosynthesis and repair protein YggX
MAFNLRGLTMARMVKCVKLSKELPGLDWQPYPNELGKRIYENVSEQAFKMWLDHAKLIINEYHLNLADPASQKVLYEQAEKFFFGDGAAMPPDYVPQGQSK